MRSNLYRLFAAAALAVSAPAGYAVAGAPAPAAPAKTPSPLDAARKALDEVGDANYQGKSLGDVIADLKDRTKLAVTVDPTVAQFGLDPSNLALTTDLKGVKLKDGLRQALAPFGLKCGLTRDGLYISTEDGLTTRQLRQTVSVDCDGAAFAAVVKQLAADTGANVVLDPRLKDKANAAVTLKLDDVPLESAVRLLAEVADLGAVRMSNVLFVTTADRAEKLRPSADAPTQPPPANPGVIGVPGVINGGPVPIPGGPGFAPGGIGGVAPQPAPAETPQTVPAPAQPPAPAGR